MATHYCEKCGKTMDEKEFYKWYKGAKKELKNAYINGTEEK